VKAGFGPPFLFSDPIGRAACGRAQAALPTGIVLRAFLIGGAGPECRFPFPFHVRPARLGAILSIRLEFTISGAAGVPSLIGRSFAPEADANP
jgi:hypothetical protein